MRVKVEFHVEVPLEDVSDEQIEEWLRFQLHDNGQMSMKNPLVNHEVEPIFGTFYWDANPHH